MRKTKGRENYESVRGLYPPYPIDAMDELAEFIARADVMLGATEREQGNIKGYETLYLMREQAQAAFVSIHDGLDAVAAILYWEEKNQ